MSRYRLERQGDHFVVMNEHRDSRAGTIKYTVRSYDGEKIAGVGSVAAGVAALASHLRANPPAWENDDDGRYTKLTHDCFDYLVVERKQNGNWIAYRNYYALGNERGPATFRTASEAQRAADLHASDERPNSACAGDGLSWLAPPDSAEEDEERCRIEHQLGERVADAAEAILRAGTEYTQGGVQSETVQAIKAAISRLCTIREASLFGSYDTERRSHDPYFVVASQQAAAHARMSFEEAAHHYGKLALRDRMGPDVSDTALREMISNALARMPRLDHLPRAA
jgi:hypothetical protein